ncbi:hypothetical protein EYD45_08645 [Hyunsoonleella flava]|uniref:Uncharacterized protein n=1 Tax=Hyunsoonleella flava TaxID=2527939 RepID=A0A4V2JA67_9FLAO|nr:hypothetical protein [Hyunsoonleella flava]TBN03576.1 hypothetical protein EYD45_08645 [Hyunsoonleella flava]
MENKKDEHLDKLMQSVFSEINTEELAPDFTFEVMSRIEAETKKELVYKPLVPKVVWVIILATLLFWVGYLFKHHFVSDSGWFSSLDITGLVPSFQLSKSVTYTVLLFALMICIQVPLLKYYFDKRFEV